jgi:hypothetical protein
MSISGRKIVLALTADGEVDLIRAMVDLLRPVLDLVVISEGTHTLSGEQRTVLGPRWRELLGLEPDAFRYVIPQLPVAGSSPTDSRRRLMFQRNALGLALRDLSPDDLLIAADADEFVDPEWLAANARGINSVVRLKMVPLFGGLDRRAPDWHCCLEHLATPPGSWPPRETGWLCPCAVIGPIGLLEGRGIAHWRDKPDTHSELAAGWHLLHVLPAHGDPSFKISRQAHEWQGVTDKEFVSLCVQAGIHRSGWWGATQYLVPIALEPVARKFPHTVLGPLASEEERRALMAEALLRFEQLENPELQNEHNRI